MQLARFLGILTLLLAWSAAGIHYMNTGEIQWSLVAAGVVFAMLPFAGRSKPSAGQPRSHSLPPQRLVTGGSPQHQHTPEEERRIREAALDQTIEGSFPASDPASTDPNPDDHTAIQRDRRQDGS